MVSLFVRHDFLNGVCGIYGLCDPRNPNSIRYVGKASDIGKRLRAHLDINRYEPNILKKRWLAELRIEMVAPRIIILARCERRELERLEASFIRAYRSNHQADLNCVVMRNIFNRKAISR